MTQERRAAWPPGPALATGALVALYLLAAVPVAARQGLYNDEIYSLRVSQQPGLHGILHALSIGADNHPPLNYWLSQLAMTALGPTPLGLRLPSILAIAGALALIFRLVRRRLGPAYGWAAAMLTLSVSAYSVSFQERGYALLVLALAVIVDAWDRIATDGLSAGRGAALLGGLLLANYAHYYGSLYLVAVAAAMAGWCWARRAVPWGILGIVAASVVLTLPLAPLARVASSFSAGFWAHPTGASLLDFYPSLLATVTPPLVGLALALALLRASAAPAVASKPGLPLETSMLLAAVACLAGPLFLLAWFVTGAFAPKYAIGAGVAICLCGVAGAARLRVQPRAAAAVVAIVPTLWFGLQVGRQVEGLSTQRFAADYTNRLARFQGRQTTPVVIGNDAPFMVLTYESGDRLTNCYFVYDVFPEARTNVDRALPGLAQITPLQIMTFERMRAEHPIFEYLGEDDYPLLERAAAEGDDVQFRHDADTNLDYWHVELKPVASTAGPLGTPAATRHGG